MPNLRQSTIQTLTTEQREFLRPDSSESRTTDAPRTSPRGRDRYDSVAEHPADGPRSRKRIPAAALPQPLQSVTLRLNATLARVLRQAAAERSIHYVAPYTQQEIAEVALRAWLHDNGYPQA